MFPATCPSWTIVFLINGVVREEALPTGASKASRSRAGKCAISRRLGLTLVLVEGIDIALGDVTENMSHGA